MLVSKYSFYTSLSRMLPAPHTNSVWIQGGGMEYDFTDCAFDQVQVRIGNGSTSAAQVNFKGSHWENPNFAVPGSVNYVYFIQDNNNGNYTRLTDSYFLQDALTGGPSTFMNLNGGKVFISGFGSFTPAGSPMASMAQVANAVNLELYGIQ
jgi:hypothetical protein